MIPLLLSIVFSVLLLVNFRIFPRFQIDNFQAIVFNYPVCFITGFLLMPEGQHFKLNFTENWTWYSLALGVGFILTFVLSGLATQKIGMTITSMANNISLVIPVMFSLFVLKIGRETFDIYNYLGIVLALIAVGIATFKSDGKNQNSKSFFTKGILALAVFFMYGITNAIINLLNLKYIPNPDRVVPVTLVMVLGAIISGWIIMLFKVLKGEEKLKLRNVVAGVSLGIPNFLSFYFVILALGNFGNNGAFVYPIYNIGVILLATLVSIIFFKEKLSNINKLGLVLAVLAIVLISWQGLYSLKGF